jgi:hypothetical protein
MEKINNSANGVADQFKQSLESLGGCLLLVCNELESLREENADLKQRLTDVEITLVDLSRRMDKAGIVSTAKIAENTLSTLPEMEQPLEVTVHA